MHAPRTARTRLLTALGVLALACPASLAQTVAPQGGWSQPPHAAPPMHAAPHAHWVVPQVGRAIGRAPIVVTDVTARVVVAGSVATTVLEVGVRNTAGRAEQAVLMVPVPGEATVTGFTFQGPASESTARFLPRDEARTLYDSIVARERDPALLEWAGWNMLRSSVFPVPAHGTQRVQIVWESLLTGSGDRLDFTLPRSELQTGVQWTIDVRALGQDFAAGYSPTHPIATERTTEGLRIRSQPRGAGVFRLSLVRSAVPTASVLTYPDPAGGGGFFLLLVAAPAHEPSEPLRREVTVVLDRSGSMAGATFERSKAAVRQILDSLGPRDRANIVDFANGVSQFAPSPTAITPESLQAMHSYVAALVPNGGTNLHDALLAALRQAPPGADTLPAVIFVTDGIPTVGRTREEDIGTLAERGNAGKRRIFTVGIGNDLAVPLLDRIADVSRASGTYVGASDSDLSVRIAEVAERLRGPALSDAELAAFDTSGVPSPGRVEEILPLRLPDLFRGGTMVVLGRYRGETPFTLAVSGTSPAGPTRIAATVQPSMASASNGFVPRLWASRRIAVLVDEIRQQGRSQGSGNDPRWRELASEIVRLSTTYGILTEYTAMLALEGSSFNDLRALEAACLGNLHGRAASTRMGGGAINQGINYNRQKNEMWQSATNSYVAPGNVQVDALSMNQCADKTFYRVGNAWADGALAGREVRVDEDIAFGSPRHREVLWELVNDGRQSALALEGEIVLEHRGRTLRVQNGHRLGT